MARRRSDKNEGSQNVSKSRSLAEPFPCHPQRPTKYAIYCTYPAGAPAGQQRLLLPTFAAAYAAKKFLDQLMQGAEYEWQEPPKYLGLKRPDAILLDNGVGIRIPQDGALQDLLEYEYSPQEEEWQLPDQLAKQCVLLRREYMAERMDEDGEKVVKPKKEPKPEKPKIDKSGLVSVGQIAEEMGIEARDARQALRKQKVEKPEGGWMWAESQVEDIKKKIKAGLK